MLIASYHTCAIINNIMKNKRDYIMYHLSILHEERELIHKLRDMKELDDEEYADKLDKNYARACVWAKRMLNPEAWSGY